MSQRGENAFILENGAFANSNVHANTVYLNINAQFFKHIVGFSLNVTWTI
jgi:hypothetical protein